MAYCQSLLDTTIQKVDTVGGGDIHQAYCLHTPKGLFFLKTNTQTDALAMFQTEAKGLALMRQCQELVIPKTYATGQVDAHAFLLLAFIDRGAQSRSFWSSFGAGLAAMHRHSQAHFGLDHANYIGRLPQSNGQHSNWSDFYRAERLEPQIQMALEQGQMRQQDYHAFQRLYPLIEQLCPEEPPALIHGDLWSGNFLCNAQQEAVLFDPACAYAHREMDLAMSRLFGGFDAEFYRAYEEAYPLAPNFEERLPLYQLYYLMVHVNLFGGSYIASVQRILRRFT